MANISFTGRLAQDAELRFTPNGKAVASLNVAENHSRKNSQTGEFEDTGTTWRRVTVWGKRGEAIADLKKGAVVLVQGREETREYEKQDGSKGYSLEVTADVVGVVTTGNQQGGGGGFQQNQQQNTGFTNTAGQTGQGANSWGGQPQQSDPWAGQANGNYNWGNEPAQDTPPV